ncbi:MAG TPA: hypothetical protein VM890_07070 [Longimicrobium sp.]|jgi:hypothetical protein|nr:hypothetical protein [Longimicrobium sp.]
MASHSPPVASLREQLVHESVAMAQYALASGMRVPAAAAATLEQARASTDGAADVAAMVRVHDQLSKLVAPATPRALLLMGPDHGGAGTWKSMMGSVALVRRMMFAAIASMVVYIAVGLSPYVNATVRTVQTSNGKELLVNELAWLAAAAMGASFAILMQVSGYVVKRNYDPRYEPSYWIKFFLGVMAGFILVQLVPLAEVTGTDPNLSQLMIALLGGFSASAVFRILTRLVDAVESLFRGDAKDEITRRENEARNRAAEETSQVRMGLAAQIVRLQQEVSGGTDPGALTARLQEILGGLVPESAPELPPSDAPPEAAAPQGTIALPGVTVVAAPPEVEADAPQPAAAAPEAG